jgi:uncharacterized protein
MKKAISQFCSMLNRSTYTLIFLLLALSACTQDVNEALVHAARKGDVREVQNLITKGADINFVTKEGRYALEVAAMDDRPEVVRVLLSKGAKIRQEPQRMTPPEIAASSGYMDVVMVFLDSGYNVNTRQSLGYTLLHVAAQEGRHKFIATLVKKGADVNARDDSGATPLFHAVGTNYADAVKVLLDAGADPNIKEQSGNCPLTLAKAEGHTEIVDMLRKKGARECR